MRQHGAAEVEATQEATAGRRKALSRGAHRSRRTKAAELDQQVRQKSGCRYRKRGSAALTTTRACTCKAIQARNDFKTDSQRQRIAAAAAAQASSAADSDRAPMTSNYGLPSIRKPSRLEDEKIAKEKEAAEERKRLLEEEQKLKEDNLAKEIAANKAAFESRIDFATRALGALSALNDAFTGDSEKEQKKAFQRNKAIGISTAIINTAGAIVGAINPAVGGLGIPAGLPGAAIAAATGVAQIATIAKSQFNSGGTPPPPPGDGEEERQETYQKAHNSTSGS